MITIPTRFSCKNVHQKHMCYSEIGWSIYIQRLNWEGLHVHLLREKENISLIHLLYILHFNSDSKTWNDSFLDSMQLLIGWDNPQIWSNVQDCSRRWKCRATYFCTRDWESDAGLLSIWAHTEVFLLPRMQRKSVGFDPLIWIPTRVSYVHQCSGSFWAYNKVGQDPSDSKSNRWHGDIFRFCFHSFEIHSYIYSSKMIGNSHEVSNFNQLFLKLNRFICN
jgi:hypothetical protein